jgi:hypothetical protein
MRRSGMRVATARPVMSAVLMTLFAVSIVGVLGMAGYGLRVLVSRWERPRQHNALLSVPMLPPLNPLQPMRPAPPPGAAPVWVPPSGSVPMPMVAPVGLATPPPMTLPPAGLPLSPPGFAPPPTFMPPQPPRRAAPPPPPVFMPPQPAPPRIAGTPPASFAPPRPPLRVGPRQPSPALVPPPRAPSPGYQVAGTLSPRLARGSIPPDFNGAELEPDTDPGVPMEALTSPEPVVQRGARYSVVRSSRR